MSRVSAADALRRLREGNASFAANARGTGTLITAARRGKLTAAQEPFAIVLGCSDSRVPAEIVFDQGLGDLFVIRVAGNIVAPSQIGSVEFAAEQFHTRLVVVLGHSGCGAILATIDQLKRPVDKQSRNLRAIVDRVRPSVEPLLAASPPGDPQALVRHAVRANVRASSLYRPFMQQNTNASRGSPSSSRDGVAAIASGDAGAKPLGSATTVSL